MPLISETPAELATRTGAYKASSVAADSSNPKPPVPRNQAKTSAAAQACHRLRRRRLVEHLRRLGPAPLYHFLNEVERGAVVAKHLEKYSRVDPNFIAALGGSHFGPAVFVIEGGKP